MYATGDRLEANHQRLEQSKSCSREARKTEYTVKSNMEKDEAKVHHLQQMKLEQIKNLERSQQRARQLEEHVSTEGSRNTK